MVICFMGFVDLNYQRCSLLVLEPEITPNLDCWLTIFVDLGSDCGTCDSFMNFHSSVSL